jgi:hypothetical protein
MLARTRVLVAAALLVGGASACSDITGVTRADGVYFLQTVNGTSVPFTTQDNAGNQITLESDTYSLNTDFTYSEQRIERINGATQSQTELGNWSQSGSLVSFTPTQSDISLSTYQGTVTNNGVFSGARSLTISINGNTAIYSE